MGEMGIVVGDVGQNLLCQILHRGEIPTPQHTTTQYPKPNLDLIQPTAVLGSEMDYMTLTARHQERSTLLPGTQQLFLTLTPTTAVHGQIAAQFQCPMGVQVVHHPVETLDVGELHHYIPNVTHIVPFATLCCNTADDLTRRHHQTADQTTCAVTLVFKL